MDRTAFFSKVRRSLFGGRLTEPQVEGLTRILDYREAKWPNMIDEELAYLLATAYHETGRKMQPIPEGGGDRYLRSKPYWPWYGRGLVQITWKRNYAKWGMSSPDDALQWPNALRIIFEGMIYGSFTGRKLSDHISADGQDYVAARAIVNGHDKAHEISDYAEAFLEALHSARDPSHEEPEPEKPMNPIIDVIAKNAVGSLWTTSIGGGLIWSQGAALLAKIASGATVGQIILSPEFAAVAGGLVAIFAKDPHK